MSNPGTPDPNAAPAVDPVVVPDPAAPAAAAASPGEAAAPAEGGAPAVVDTGAPPSDPAAPAVDPAAPPAKREDWRDRRIAVLTAKLKEKGETPPAAAAVPDPNAPPPTVDVNAEALRLAHQISAQNDFNKRCQQVAEKGKTVFKDFDERIGNLQHLFTPGNVQEEAAYVTLLQAALETGDPERVLYELGGDMDHAEKLMNMSPVKLGMEIAKLASKKGEPDPSSLPKPITPVGQRGQTAEEIDPADASKADKLSTKTWMQRRQKYIEDLRKQGVRIA